MSTEVKISNPDEAQEALHNLRSSGSSDQSYVLLCHDTGNPNVVVFDGSGTSIDELCDRLDDGQVQYALVKMDEVFDITSTTKFVYIHWIGDKVPMAKKGRYGVVHGSVKDQFFSSSHIDIETSSRDDVSPENIIKLMNANSGTLSKVLEVSAAESVQKRGFTSTPTTQPPKSKSTMIPVSSKGATVAHGDDVTEAIASVRNDSNQTRWACIGYQDGNVKNPLTCIKTGTGSVEELTDLIDDSNAQYILYRTSDVIDGLPTVKFVCITWVGDNMKPMAKAKLSTHKGDVEALFSPFHVRLFATARNEISESIISDKVQSASGTKSHVK